MNFELYKVHVHVHQYNSHHNAIIDVRLTVTILFQLNYSHSLTIQWSTRHTTYRIYSLQISKTNLISLENNNNENNTPEYLVELLDTR